jgi:hypothetical protein
VPSSGAAGDVCCPQFFGDRPAATAGAAGGTTSSVIRDAAASPAGQGMEMTRAVPPASPLRPAPSYPGSRFPPRNAERTVRRPACHFAPGSLGDPVAAVCERGGSTGPQVSQRTQRVDLGGAGGEAQPARARQLHVPESLLPSLQVPRRPSLRLPRRPPRMLAVGGWSSRLAAAVSRFGRSCTSSSRRSP